VSVAIDLTGQVAVVTGATGGIGQGIARRFHAAGATVVIHYHTDRDTAEHLARQLGGAPMAGADLTDQEGPARMVRQVIDSTGRIDHLVNNAGIQPRADLADVDDAAWSRTLDMNLTAVHRLSREAVVEMQEGATITHISSIEGSHPALAHGHYSVSKAGLVMHARAASLEWGRRGIRVNTVSPGLIHRDGIEEQWPEGVARWQRAAPLGRLGTPGDVGDACVFLASDLARWITGIDLIVDGGVSNHPTW
jgi:NAD(P)-dependent dehydrogenase (short-subunit alcohol dehydrogenase family)